MAFRRIRSALVCGLMTMVGLAALAAVPAHAAYVNAVLADSPVGYWRMNETHAGGSGLIGPIYNYATGAPVQEDSGRGYYDFGNVPGSMLGAEGPRPPAFPGFDDDNRAPWFDGNNDLVFINSKSQYEITGALTLEAWVNPDVLQTQSIVGKFDTGNNKRSYLLQVLSDGKARFFANPTGTSAGNVYVDSTATVPTGQWTHLAATFSPSGDDNFMQVYINGTLRGERTTGVPASIHSNDTAVRMGYHRGGGTNTGFYEGRMDEVAIYDTALTGQQIAHHVLEAVRVPFSARMHLSLDETTGTTAYDATSGGSHGALIGSGFTFDARSVPGVFDRALQFNGSSDYVSIADGGNLPGASDDFTVAFWAKTDNWTGTPARGILASYNMNDLQFSIGLDRDNGLLVGANSSLGTLNEQRITESLLNGLDTDEFAHFAFVFGAGGAIDDIYLNGLPAGSSYNNHWFFNDADLFTLGRRVRSGSSEVFFDGELDDFAIFDRALTAPQVNAVMNFGVSAFTIPEPSSLLLLIMASLAVLLRRRQAR